MSRYWVSLAAVLVLDQWSKWMVASHMDLFDSIPIIPGMLWFTYVHNRGAAFSMLEGGTLFFIISAVLIIVGITVYNVLTRLDPMARIVTGLIVGGAAGNFIDRWRFGYVMDFIDIHIWPVFNVADMALTCGGILFFIYFLQQERANVKHE